jgi:excisionase family DNA binding protein
MDAVFESPSKADKRISKDASVELNKIAKDLLGAKAPVEIAFQGYVVKVPAKAARLFCNIIDQMAQGASLAVVRQERLMTPQEAADFLKVSRTSFMKLVKAKEIPSIATGRYHRIIYSDLLAYEQALRADRFTQMVDIAKRALELDLEN